MTIAWLRKLTLNNMSRIKHKIPEHHLTELRSLVEYTFGQKVLNVNDCINLSNSIFLTVKSSVSPDTLRRLYGLIETKTQPSLYTLETISKYVGFNTYHDFINSFVLVGKHFFYRLILDCTSNKQMPFEALEALQKIKPSPDYYSTLHQLIILAYQKKDTSFFENFFTKQLGFDWLSIYKYEIYQTIQLLGKLVEDSDWLQEIALKKYVALPFHFDYFIEWYVADEQIYYLKLLEKYKEAHHENPEKLIFYYSISAIISFKKQKFDKLSSYSEQLNTLENQCVPNNILKARIIGVHYLNDLKNGNLNADNKIIAIDFETLFPDIGDRVTSVFFLFNYLFEAKAFDLMIKLFERFLSHEVVFFSIWTRINWNQLCVFMAQAYLENKQENQAKSYFIQIQPSLFEIFNKNYFHRIYDKLSLSF
jgi:hypothetical protein